MRNVIILSIFCFLSYNLWGQQSNVSEHLDIVEFHSPDIAAFSEFGKVPVSLSTGTPNIEIPLIHRSDNDFNMDISINYNATGIKVDDVSTVVGLGWILNAGGVITRKVNGIPDETLQRGFLNVDITPSMINSDYYAYFMYNTQYSDCIDCMPDEFTYNFMGYTGSFQFGPDKKIHLLPFANLQFTFVHDDINNSYFEIRNEQGHVFLFKDTEAHTINQNGSSNNIGSWKLTKIILNNNAGEIDFAYTSGFSYSDIYYRMTVTKAVITFDQNLFWHTNRYDKTNTQRSSFDTYNVKHIKEIDFSYGGKIVFDYDNETRRQDFTSGKILREIKMYNNDWDSVPNYTWHFQQIFTETSKGYNASYNDDADKFRMFLNSVEKESADGTKETYKMEYDEMSLPCRKSFGKDYWGYYNGKDDNRCGLYINSSDLNTINEINLYSTLGIANRDVDESYITAGMLAKIQYPTGGYNIFKYEPNRISATENGGGVRIKEILSYGNNNELINSKHFKYGKNEDGIGRISTFNYKSNFKNIECGDGVYSAEGLYTQVYYNLYTLHDNPFFPSRAGYEYVTEYTQNSDGRNGKIIYQYDFESDNDIDQEFFQSNSWKSGNLLSKTVYESYNGGFRMVSKEEYAYSRHNMYRGLTYGITPIFISNDATPYSQGGYIQSAVHSGSFFTSSAIPIRTEAKKLRESKMINYFYNEAGKDSVVQVLENHYDGIGNAEYPHDFVTKSITHGSSQQTIEVEQRYISDFYEEDPRIDSVYDEMLRRNMVAVPLEIVTRKNNAVIRANIDLFEKDSYGNIVNSENKSLKTSAPVSNYAYLSLYPNITADSRVTTDTYKSKYNHSAKLTEYRSEKDGYDVVILWSYSCNYPIAQIMGVSYSDVESVLGATTISSFADKPNPSLAEIKAFLLPLLSATKTKNALITCYSYIPLVGMASQTEPNGLTTYYEYDDFGRLKRIRNNTNEIIEEYDYHFKQ